MSDPAQLLPDITPGDYAAARRALHDLRAALDTMSFPDLARGRVSALDPYRSALAAVEATIRDHERAAVQGRQPQPLTDGVTALPRVEDLFTCDPGCPTCAGSGHVCEAHPDRPWGEGDGCCGAPGIPCRPENRGLQLVERCEDCAEGDHSECSRQGGWPFQDTNERCACHLRGHREART